MAQEGDKGFGVVSGKRRICEGKKKKVQKFHDVSRNTQTFKTPRRSVSPSGGDQLGPSTSSNPTYSRAREEEAEEDEFDPYLTPPRKESDAELYEDEVQAKDRHPEDNYRIVSVESRCVEVLNSG